jgi:hypothetical protein
MEEMTVQVYPPSTVFSTELDVVELMAHPIWSETKSSWETFFKLSLAACLIQTGCCFYLIEAIPEQVIRLFLWNV